MKNILLILILTGIFSACLTTKELKMPVTRVPNTYGNSSISISSLNTADTGSFANLPWQSLFADSGLKSLVDSALVRNYDLNLALKNIEEAGAIIKQVKWNAIPKLNLSITANTTRPSDNSLNGLSLKQYNIGTSHIEDYSSQVLFSWEADIWGKIRLQKKSALASYLESLEAKRAIQTTLISSISQGYFNLRMLDSQLEIAKKNAALEDSTVRILKLQYAAGQVTSLAVEQAQAQAIASEELIPQFEQSIQIQENALQILAGSFPKSLPRTNNKAPNFLLDQFNPGIPTQILSRRPDVKAKELAVLVADAKMGISKIALYPNLQITASGGLDSYLASHWYQVPGSLFGMVTGSLVQPLINNRSLTTQYEIAKIEKEKAVLQFRQSVLAAVGEVSNALVQIEKLKTQVKLAEERVNALQNAIKNSNLLFNSGLANYLEVITAQNSLLQSELELATLNRDQHIAISELYRSLGGG